MYSKKFYLTFFILLICMAGSASAIDIYWWTNASGDGMWDRDTTPYNWEKVVNWNEGGTRTPCGPPVHNSSTVWLSGNDATLATPLVIPAGYNADCTYGEEYGTIYGPEWGMHLDIYGSLTYKWYIVLAQTLDGLNDPDNPDNDPNRSVLSMYENSRIHGTEDSVGDDKTRAEGIAIGTNWWEPLPYVTMNMYDDAECLVNWAWLGGHLNLYGGTFDVLDGFNMGIGTPENVPDEVISLDIHGGTLILPADFDDDVQDWIDRGILKAYGEVPNPGIPSGPQINVDITTLPDRTIVTATSQSPPEASGPNPANGATEALVDSPLTWRAGLYADQHDVFIGTDPNDINDVSASTIADYPNVTYNTVSESSISADLELATTYHWRVDEVNEAHPDMMWKGDVWTFTTSDYLVVDDFEAYNDINIDLEGSNRIYLTWLDGYDNPEANGSTMGYPDPFFPDDEHFVEITLVHGGKQSAPLFYNNSTASCSEVTVNPAELTVGTDWTRGGVEVLTIWFYGATGNATTEQLYVKVNNAKQVISDINLTEEAWQNASIDLTALGTNPSNVTSFTIGLERTGSPGGSGVLFIDDIRLYLADASQ